MPGYCPPQQLVFFADEAGISNDRFTVVGGICVHRDAIPILHDNVSAFRERHNMRSELKWSKISDQKLEEYKALVDFFFAMNNTNVFHFHAIAFDSHQANHHRYNDGDSDIGLSKLYGELILHKFCHGYPHDGGLAVCLDQRNSSTKLEDLRRIINSRVNRKLGLDISPVKQLVSMDSKLDDLLQINDVILGAVCAARNGRNLLVNGRKSKRDIAQIVLDKSGLRSFETNSPRHVKRFTMWNFAPRPR